jgi:hypothetical protein
MLFFFFVTEKLLTSEGRELRRALFSLKQIFQEDKDLVHGFVALGGLNCLVQIGNEADQNYQNYILRALGQVSAVVHTQFIALHFILTSLSVGVVRDSRAKWRRGEVSSKLQTRDERVHSRINNNLF